MTSVVMRINKKLLAAIGIPMAIGVWAAFRPELIFINQSVNEKAPVVSQKSDILASGKFASWAHETTGTAQIFRVGGKQILRLSGFHTSNGPDVRVFLVRGSDIGKVDESSVELGSLKGNIGDQNYELPSNVRASDFTGVNIWCKRFSVGFGGAELVAAPKESASHTSFRLAGYSPIEVTAGIATGDRRFVGRAAIIEENGQRFVTLGFKKVPPGNFSALLLKQETASLGDLNPKIPFINLGALQKGAHKVSISKEIDAWLYRSIVLVETDSKRVLGTIQLRSAQEAKPPLFA